MLSGFVTTLEPREDACVWPDIYTAWLSTFLEMVFVRGLKLALSLKLQGVSAP